MTMVDGKCEICGGPPIGVASTIMPYSCAYCVECCQRFAQPMIVFECFFDDFGADFKKMRDGLDQLETWDHKNAKYITYREYANQRKAGISSA